MIRAGGQDPPVGEPPEATPPGGLSRIPLQEQALHIRACCQLLEIDKGLILILACALPLAGLRLHPFLPRQLCLGGWEGRQQGCNEQKAEHFFMSCCSF